MAKRKTKEEKLEGLSNFLDRSAKRLTVERTKWEAIMFKVLSDLHYRFQFQVPFIHTPKGNGKPKGYILDFVLTDYKIVIEIDSVQHHTSKKDVRYDNQRTKKLKLQGYEVIRLMNKQVSVYSKEMIDQIIKTKISLISVKN